jgi:hypothetical protein
MEVETGLGPVAATTTLNDKLAKSGIIFIVNYFKCILYI